ncbi:MAG TPA: PAS domain S-box protein, partial [Thermoanaerobaculia bacterium]
MFGFTPGFGLTVSAGISLAVLIAVLVLIVRTSRIRTRLLEQANRQLEAEMAEHRLAEEKTRLILELSQSAFISIDPQSRITNWNRQAEATFGWKREEALGRTLPDTIIPPQHHEAHQRGLQRFLATGEGPMLNRLFEMTALHKDGHEFPVEMTLWPMRWMDNYTFHAFINDVSRRKEAEDALRASEERFRLLTQNVQDYAIFMLDPEGRVASWNIGAEKSKQYRAEEILGRHFSVFYTPEAIAAGKPAEALETAKNSGRVEEEGWRVRKDGSRFWANIVITALHDESGNITGFSKITRDTTERKQAEEKLKKFALQDELTGLYNRRGFLAMAQHRMNIAAREKKSLVIFFADLDGLKRINDTLGHEAGDASLATAADVLRDSFRAADVIGRIGGDEFAVLAAVKSLEDLPVIESRLSKKIMAQTSLGGGMIPFH